MKEEVRTNRIMVYHAQWLAAYERWNEVKSLLFLFLFFTKEYNAWLPSIFTFKPAQFTLEEVTGCSRVLSFMRVWEGATVGT